MRIRPFAAIRPPADLAVEVASLPYDVGDLDTARAEAQAHPMSFLHVERPEVDLPDTFDAATGIHHQTAAFNFQRFLQQGVLVKEARPALYIYRITLGAHEQTGVLTTCHIDDYYADVIKKHEKTKKPTEDDRTGHVLTVGAQTGPIFLLHRDQPTIDGLVAEIKKGAPLYDFTAVDGIRHTVWRVEAAAPLVEAFAAIPVAYVADGHHRAAAAARAGVERRKANPHHTGQEEYNWFLAVLFPARQLQILAYNRMVRDLNGLTAEAFLEEVRRRFPVTENAAPRPAAPGSVSLYLGGRWYGLRTEAPAGTDPVAALDVSILQDRLLAPVLGIADPRNNSRVEYLGGFRSVEDVQQRVDRGQAAVGFSVHPTTVDQLMAISDAGQIMPPKSTWFEPKLRSGLFVHGLD
jgi:uncharacterized protein (DUF1015 family)